MFDTRGAVCVLQTRLVSLLKTLIVNKSQYFHVSGGGLQFAERKDSSCSHILLCAVGLVSATVRTVVVKNDCRRTRAHFHAHVADEDLVRYSGMRVLFVDVHACASQFVGSKITIRALDERSTRLLVTAFFHLILIGLANFDPSYTGDTAYAPAHKHKHVRSQVCAYTLLLCSPLRK